jgi:hypothetical protein
VPGQSAVPEWVGPWAARDSGWDYGGGVRVGRPLGARRFSPVRGPVTLKINTQHTPRTVTGRGFLKMLAGSGSRSSHGHVDYIHGNDRQPEAARD